MEPQTACMGCILAQPRRTTDQCRQWMDWGDVLGSLTLIFRFLQVRHPDLDF